MIIPESNRHYKGDSETKFVAYDRIYQNLHKTLELVNKDGTIYLGKITKRAIKCEGFMSHTYVTADNRWFDRAGMPIKKPNNLYG